MITLAGVRRTIEDIKKNGNNMADLHDLEMLYELEERMKKRDEDRNAEGEGMELTRAEAERWVSRMRNEDPTKGTGGKWTMDQVRPYAQKHGLRTDGPKFIEFFAVMNAMYSDYCEVAKKYNAATPDFFAEMAKAFIEDRDARKGKTALYYKHIAEK